MSRIVESPLRNRNIMSLYRDLSDRYLGVKPVIKYIRISYLVSLSKFMVFSQQFWPFQRGDSSEQLTLPSARFLQQVYTFSFITLSHCFRHFVSEVKLTWKIESRSNCFASLKMCLWRSPNQIVYIVQTIRSVYYQKRSVVSSQSLIPSVRTCVCQYSLFLSCPQFTITLICRNRTTCFIRFFLLSCVPSVLFSLDVTSLLVFCTSICLLMFVCLLCQCLFNNHYALYIRIHVLSLLIAFQYYTRLGCLQFLLHSKRYIFNLKLRGNR